MTPQQHFTPDCCIRCSKSDKKHRICTLNSLPLSEVKDCCLWHIIYEQIALACSADGTGGNSYDK
ncbi:MAG TPA: hypothetical protein O0X39_03165 [Methanocorpusculum sp.]|nr:hypothetical protein [Methanocorpusculum sp.]